MLILNNTGKEMVLKKEGLNKAVMYWKTDCGNY